MNNLAFTFLKMFILIPSYSKKGGIFFPSYGFEILLEVEDKQIA